MHKVVLQLTSNDPSIQKSMISHIHNIQKSFDEIEMEVVTHGNGIELLLKSSLLEHSLQKMKDSGVRLLVCKNALDAKKLSDSDVLPFCEVIPSAVAHLIVRQSEGWLYLRETF